MLGFLLQWPTLLTLAMFPVLVVMYIRLAKHEERYALATYGDSYRQYMAHVPAFFPSLRWKREIAGLAFTGNARMAGHQTDGPVEEVLENTTTCCRRRLARLIHEPAALGRAGFDVSVAA
jgi:hypothetical protein